MTTYVDDAVFRTVVVDPSPSSRVVLIPVARFDRRAVAALSHAQMIPAAERIAVHVVEDQCVADELELSWLCSELDIPLELLHTGLPVADAVAEVAEDCLQCGANEVVVVIVRQVLRRRMHRLLHDRSS